MPPGGGGGRGGRSTGAVNGDGSVHPSEAGSVGGHVGNGEHGGGRVFFSNRDRGFGSSRTTNRFETPTIKEMKLKQNAIVAKFMTYLQRQNTLVVELYRHCFYKLKPTAEKIAEFIYRDLCPTAILRQSVMDVQLHPVKMLLFVKFSDEQIRDEVVLRLQSPQGVIWSGSDYGVKVKGYSVDSQIKFIRLLGVSPETSEHEIRKTFNEELGIGEVMDIKKGFLDAEKLPGCTNGDWELRVKISNQEQIIPSYILRRDEGELWSLNFEGRIWCCWKCGNNSHIGDKCPQLNRTFDEVFNRGGIDKPTWAVVTITMIVAQTSLVVVGVV